MTAKSFKYWLASRKFTLLVFSWLATTLGGIILYYDAESFEQKLDLFREVANSNLWTYGVFASIEGGKEIWDAVKGSKTPQPPITYSSPDAV